MKEVDVLNKNEKEISENKEFKILRWHLLVSSIILLLVINFVLGYSFESILLSENIKVIWSEILIVYILIIFSMPLMIYFFIEMILYGNVNLYLVICSFFQIVAFISLIKDKVFIKFLIFEIVNIIILFMFLNGVIYLG